MTLIATPIVVLSNLDGNGRHVVRLGMSLVLVGVAPTVTLAAFGPSAAFGAVGRSWSLTGVLTADVVLALGWAFFLALAFPLSFPLLLSFAIIRLL